MQKVRTDSPLPGGPEEVFTIARTNLCSLARWILRLVALGHLHPFHQSFQVTELKVEWNWAREGEREEPENGACAGMKEEEGREGKLLWSKLCF